MVISEASARLYWTTIPWLLGKNGKTLLADVVMIMITGTLTTNSKTLRTSELITMQNAPNITRAKAKARTEETTKVIEKGRVESRHYTAGIKRSITIGEEMWAAAEEATEEGSSKWRAVYEAGNATHFLGEY
jgi:hypothetical protein